MISHVHCDAGDQVSILERWIDQVTEIRDELARDLARPIKRRERLVRLDRRDELLHKLNVLLATRPDVSLGAQH